MFENTDISYVKWQIKKDLEMEDRIVVFNLFEHNDESMHHLHKYTSVIHVRRPDLSDS